MNRHHSVASESLPVYSAGGAVVGEITRDAEGQRWLEKHGIDPARHQLRTPRAWCTDAAHLELLRETSRVRSWQRRAERRGCCPWWSGKRVHSNIRLPGRSFAKTRSLRASATRPSALTPRRANLTKCTPHNARAQTPLGSRTG